jgi:glucose/arabinose dehydrogenase
MNPSFRTPLALALAAVGPLAHAQLKSTLVTSGLGQPVGYYADPTNSSVAYVTQKTGQVVRLNNGVASGNVVDLGSRVATDGERGLLGLAFDPNYASNNRVYMSYVDEASKALRVVRTNGFDLGTAQTIIDVDHPTAQSNHYGGTIRFGGDGKLYVGMGDGGGANDPENDAQNTNSLLGKILRLDVSGNGTGYSLPTDNPFANGGGRGEVWAYGLRNPYKFSFDTNGDLYIGDVGQDTREEVDRIGATQGGVNFGWRTREGSGPNPATDGSTPPGAVDPIFDYGRSVGGSITGGFVYRGSALGSSYVGRYFFGDFVSRKVFSIDPNASNVGNSLIDHTSSLGISPQIVSLDPGAGGEIFLTDISGRIYRVDAVPEPASMAALALGVAAVLRRRKKA